MSSYHPAPACCGSGGGRIAKKLQVPFIADLRDPWAEMDIVSETATSPLYFSLAHCLKASLSLMQTRSL